MESAGLRNPLELSSYIKSKVNDTDEFYIFIDEIQFCQSIPNPSLKGDFITFYDVLNSLLIKGNLDVYITGSNSRMLSSDILTELRGRGDEIRVFPLSFHEFYSARGGDRKEAFNEYMIFGGMPMTMTRATAESKTDYLKRLFDETYFKDIIERRHIGKADALSEITDCLCSVTGSLTNVHNLADTINSAGQRRNGDRISDGTVKSYMDYLNDAFLFSEAKRYDVRGRKYFEYQSKFYCVDHGLRNARINMRKNEEPHIMENIIYNDLIMRGCNADVGVAESYTKDSSGKTQRITREIDFVVNNGNSQCYIQSAFDMSSKEKQDSELKPFSIINDSFRKIVVTKDESIPWFDDNGILHIGIYDFLMRKDAIL